jgi:hypothetical protein
MGGYLLFACGLINLRYQWGEPDIASRSALIFVPGAIVILATFIPGVLKVLARREIKVVLAVLGLILVAYALNN